MLSVLLTTASCQKRGSSTYHKTKLPNVGSPSLPLARASKPSQSQTRSKHSEKTNHRSSLSFKQVTSEKHYIYIYIYIYICIYIYNKDFKKWYEILSCLTLSNIRYISRVKWSKTGKGVAPSPYTSVL